MAKTFATWNPSDSGSNVTLSNGNLTVAVANYVNSTVRGTIAVTTGKWYWEYKITKLTNPNTNSGSVPAFGAYNSAIVLPSSAPYTTVNTDGTTATCSASQTYAAVYAPNSAVDDVWGIALDADAKAVAFYKNGALVRTNTGLTATSFSAFFGETNGGCNTEFLANFGATAFAYSVPTGYNAGLYTGVADTIPDAPTAASASAATSSQITVSFTAPTNNGGATITGYTVTSSPGNITATGSVSPINVAGLTPGTSYTFTVYATNSVGDSVESGATSALSTLADLPGAPTAVSGANASTTTVEVLFTAPASNGGGTITSYTATSTPGNHTGSGTTSPITVSGLDSYTSYTFTVHATNSAGNGSESSASSAIYTLASVADAPTNVAASNPASHSLDVAFTAPTFDGGSTITSYTVTSTPGNHTATGSVSPITVTGLDLGTEYTFTVTAFNGIGNSAASTASSAVSTLNVPGVPTSVSAGNATAHTEDVSFTAPTSDGGSAITGYTVTSTPGNFTATGTESPITVSGLTRSTSYTFTVKATNDIGDSLQSDATTEVSTLPEVPSAPTAVVASNPTGTQETVSFDAPTDDGGATITGYTVTSSPGNITATGSVSPINVTGLSQGTAYAFTVVASNSAGGSSASAPSDPVPTLDVPVAPTNVIAAYPTGTSESVSFSASATNGGSAITGYTVTSTPGNHTGTGANSPIVVEGLSIDTAYTFTVHAINAIGNSSESTASDPVSTLALPTAPTAVDVADPTGTQVTVTFVASASDGGSAVTGYTVTSTPGNHTASGISSPINVTGLDLGTAYTFTVHATTAVGDSVESTASDSISTLDVPDAPTEVVASDPTNTEETVSFTAPTSDGGSVITGYTVTSTPGNFTATGTASPILVSGLSRGTAYTFTVHATTAVGDSVESSASASVSTTADVPGAPTAVVASNPTGTQETVSFTAPTDNGGATITVYTATSTPGNHTGIDVASPIVVSGLTPNTEYTFTVHASNHVGAGPESAPSDPLSTVVIVPGSPTNIVASAATNNQVTVSFTSGYDGGSAITGYTVTSTPGNFTATGTESPIDVTGLSSGVSYTFTVHATNSAGDSAESASSNALSTLTVPDAPTNVSTGNITSTQIDVGFDAPTSDGGSAVTGYTVTSTPGNHTASGLINPLTVTGLDVGTAYTFTVHAINIYGNSLESAQSTEVSTLSVAPDAPTNVVAADPTDTELTVSFDAPTFTGGATVTAYTVTSYPGNYTATGSASPITVSGLTHNNTYTFTVSATNSAGTSVESVPSAQVETLNTVPDAPTSVVGISSTGTSITVEFTPPVHVGEAPILSYTVTSNPGNHTATGSVSPITVEGLTHSTSYTFTVVATNSIGDSIASAESPAFYTSHIVPDVPTAVAVSNAQSHYIDVSFTAPTEDGGSAITEYVVTAVSFGHADITANGSASPITVLGLSPNTEYTFTVHAVNAVGAGAESTASDPISTIASVVPEAPTNVTVGDAGINQITVAFDAPMFDGGEAVTEYTAISFPDAITATGATSPIVVTGLHAAKSYTFTVVATNLIGNSLGSSASAALSTLNTIPDAPTDVIASNPTGSNITVAFTPPTFNGGAAITEYTVVSNPLNIRATATSSPIDVTGLHGHTEYTFTVIATNSIGDSAPSAESVPLSTSPVVPDAPTNVSAGNVTANQEIVSFTESSDSGGSAITGYTATSTPGNHTGTSTASPIAVAGLDPRTSYTFTVYATNSVGDSPESAASTAVYTLAVIPDAPTSVFASDPQGHQLKVTFTEPSYDGGDTITSYTAISTPGNYTATGNASPLVVTGLDTGTEYTFTVHATNAIGNSVESIASSAMSTLGVPDAPTSVVASSATATQESVSFSVPGFDGGSAITGYTVTSTPGNFTASGSASPLVVTGLTPATSYTFTVYATNAQGNSAESTPSSSLDTLPVVPDAPTNIVAYAPGINQGSVSFTSPTYNGGSVITGYTVTSTPGNFTATGTASPIDVTGLTPEVAYTFAVHATNSVGDSAESAASNSITTLPQPIAPNAPTNVASSAATANSMQVTFTAPTFTGYSAITGYTVTSSPGNITANDTVSPIVVYGLSPNVSYTFTVTATNLYGTSVASSASTARSTLATVSDAPTDVVASQPGDHFATVTFLAPALTGGLPVTSYTITSSPDGVTKTGPDTEMTVTGLRSNVAYTFTVKAYNSQGASVASTVSNSVSTLAALPDAPTSVLTSNVHKNQITVAFTAPADTGGLSITSYTVTSSPDNKTATSSVSPINVTDLTPNTEYTFTVTAHNALGNSLPSVASTAVYTSSVPDAPLFLVASNPTLHGATVSFTPPYFDGRSAITSYTVKTVLGATIGDPSWNNVVLLMHMEGADGGTTFTDEIGHVVTQYNSAVTSTTQKKFGATSAKFNNTAMYLYTPSSPDYAFGTGNFTIEFWIYPSTLGNDYFIHFTSGPSLHYNTTYMQYYNFTGGVAINSSAGALSTGAWQHVAYVRNGTTVTLYVDGVSKGSGTDSGNIPASQLYIGSYSGGSDWADGYIDELRITKGVARYTTAFTPPTAPFAEFTYTPITATGSSSPITITGLSSSTTYTFTATATNAEGTSAETFPESNGVTTAVVPTAPTAVVASNALISTEVVSFTAPSSNGGDAITGYTVTGTYSVVGDQYWNNVVLLAHLNSSNVEVKGHGVTSSTMTYNTSTPKFGSACGNTSKAVIYSASSDFALTADFTIELFAYPVNYKYGGGWVGSWSGAACGFWYTGSTGTGGAMFSIQMNGGIYHYSTIGIPLNQWSHVAASRTGDQLTLWVNGVNAGTFTDSRAFMTAAADLCVGYDTSTGTDGGTSTDLFDELRITKGVGRYTTAFTPTTAAFLEVLESTSTVTATGASSPITVTGLAARTPYYFTVAAINGAGTGPYSAPSNTLATIAVPGSPTGVTVGASGGVSTYSTLSTTRKDASITLSNANLTAVGTIASWYSGVSSLSVSSGKVYWEVTGLDVNTLIGVVLDSAISGYTTNNLICGFNTGNPRGLSGLITRTTSTVYGFALDLDNGALYISQDGTWLNGGVPTSGATKTGAVTGLGGTITAGASYSAFYAITGVGQGCTFRFGPTGMTGTVPTGYSTGILSTAPGITPSQTQAVISFTAPVDNGGSSITGYTVTSTPGNFTQAGSASPLTVTGLTGNTSYTFTAVATNMAGNSVGTTTPAVLTAPTVPSQPLSVSAVSTGPHTESVSFSAPTTNGGSPITVYTVTSNPGGFTGTGLTSPIVVSGLSLGVAYSYTVTATNAVGVGAPSIPTSPTTTTNSVTVTNLGVNSFKLTVLAGNAIADVLYEIGNQLPNYGWQVYDASYYVYRALNQDGGYKYLKLRITGASAPATATTEVYESWNTTTHTGTNRAGPNLTPGTYDDTLKTAFYISSSSTNISIYVYANPRWLLFGSDVGGTFGMGLNAVVNNRPWTPSDYRSLTSGSSAVYDSIYGNNTVAASGGYDYTYCDTHQLTAYTGMSGVVEFSRENLTSNSNVPPFFWTHTGWWFDDNTAKPQTYDSNSEATYISYWNSYFEARTANVIGFMPRTPAGATGTAAGVIMTSEYMVDSAVSYIRSPTSTLPLNLFNNKNPVFDVGVRTADNNAFMGMVMGMKVARPDGTLPSITDSTQLVVDSNFFIVKSGYGDQTDHVAIPSRVSKTRSDSSRNTLSSNSNITWARTYISPIASVYIGTQYAYDSYDNVQYYGNTYDCCFNRALNQTSNVSYYGYYSANSFRSGYPAGWWIRQARRTQFYYNQTYSTYTYSWPTVTNTWDFKAKFYIPK